MAAASASTSSRLSNGATGAPQALPAAPPTRFSDSPNARSKSISTVETDTFGILNRHASKNTSYQVGVSEDRGTRRVMEDAHSFVTDFDNIRGQGFFAVFDGHAGKHAAEWCGQHFHESLLDTLHSSPELPIPDALNVTFHSVDESLSRMCDESDGKIHSGCTAVTAFLRLEDADSCQSFLAQSPASADGDGSPTTPKSFGDDGANFSSSDSLAKSTVSASVDEHGHKHSKDPSHSPTSSFSGSHKSQKSSSPTSTGKRSRIKQALKSIGSSSISGPFSPRSSPKSSRPASPSGSKPAAAGGGSEAEKAKMVTPPATARRVLYTANAGDARAVLCRGGKAIRLTYDHKGTDRQEAKRITDAGGFVMSGRVNGVLAVTRSLGDSSMKDFVVGAPYTTETELCDEDEFVIFACDGLWDVVGDQGAIDIVRTIVDAQEASQKLLKYALSNHTTDNVTVLVVRLKNPLSKFA